MASERRATVRQKVKNEAGILLWDQLLDFNTWKKKEFRFTTERKWRFDFAIAGKEGRMFGIEIEGGAWTQGRHTRGKGFIEDMHKYNCAALRGWRVLRFTPDQVLRGEAIAFIRRALES